MPTKPVKNNGTYDGRSNAGRQSKGKTRHPKQTERQMGKGLDNSKKSGKKI